nr:unnamed protein product [Naegleria fowleri]
MLTVSLQTELFLACAFLASAAGGTSKMTTTVTNVSISLVFFSLFSWIAYWFRLVLYVKAKTTKPAIAFYVFLSMLSIAVGILVPTIVTSQQSLQQVIEFFTYYLLALSLLTLILFVVCSVWIYWAMKKVSDVNMLNTSFVRFVIYSSISILIFSTAYLIITQVSNGFFIAIISGIFSVVIHVTLASITLGLTYMEFDKEDFMKFYSCCFKSTKSTGHQSTFVANNTSVNNRTTTNESQQLMNSNEDVVGGFAKPITYYSKMDE